MNIAEFSIEGWEESEVGIVICENEQWVLIKSIPMDYAIDGYKLIAKKFITETTEPVDVSLLNRVFELKKISTAVPEGFTLGSTLENLQWVESQYGLFEFQDDDETVAMYGKIHSCTDETFTIDMVKIDGTVDDDFDCEFNLNAIRVITFESDYHYSMQLLYQSHLA